MTLKQLFNDFIDNKKAGGLILVFVTALSLGLANSPWKKEYINFWHFEL
jgi:NhaA family Na+:H+ antiporter